MILVYTLISDVWELEKNSILNRLNRRKDRSSVISNIQKTANEYLKCTLNLNLNSKNEAFSLNRSRENEDKSWYLRALFWKY